MENSRRFFIHKKITLGNKDEDPLSKLPYGGVSSIMEYYRALRMKAQRSSGLKIREQH